MQKCNYVWEKFLFFAIVQFINMADMTSGASQRFPDSSDVEVGEKSQGTLRDAY